MISIHHHDIVDILHVTQKNGPFGGYIKMIGWDELSYHMFNQLYGELIEYIKFILFDYHILFIV